MSEKISQICYYDRNERQPISLSITGQSNYTFPTMLSKKPGVPKYHFGVEAEYFGVHKNEILIENLYNCFHTKSDLIVDNEAIAPAVLLGEFIKSALSMLGVADVSKSIKAVMLTVPRISKSLVENLKEASALLGFGHNQIFLQDYNESFYYHTMYQKPEYSSRKVALFTVESDGAMFSELQTNKQTKPALVTVKRGRRVDLSENYQERDEAFYNFAKQSFGEEAYSSVFIIGNGFDKSWAVKSIPLLCRHQRPVFYGNNLYCKGACYAAKDKVEDRALKEYLFSGPDLVKVNIGMNMMIAGISAYHPLIEAGVNWHEAFAECEILLDDVKELIFIAKRMDKAEKNRCVMALPNLPKRPPKATRLKIKMEFETATKCNITVEDLGLGEFYPSSGLIWHEMMTC